MRRRGFTLVEVLIAVAITAFLGVAMSMAFGSTFSAKDTVEASAERFRGVRGAFSRMSREIGAAYVSDRYDSRRYRDAFDRPTNFVGQADRLLFTSMAHQRRWVDAKESDQMVVEYSLKTSREKDRKNQYDLIRREKVVLEERMDREGVEDVLMENVKKLEFEYWSPEKKQWEREWDTRRPDQRSLLPTRVRITVLVANEDNKDVRYTTQTRVMLNTEFPRFQ